MQAVTGYFSRGYEITGPGIDWQYVDPVYEGEGSAFTEFTLTLPDSDKPGISKPNVRPTSIVPSTSSDVSPTSDLDNPPQSLPQFYLMGLLFVLCVVAVLLGVIVYLFKQRQTSLN